MKRQRDCARCGAGVGRRGREYCCNCWRKIAAAAAKAACPKRGKLSILQPGTSACKACSRACASCGHPVRRLDAVLCQSCRQQERRRAAQRPCPRCGRPGYLREDTGWCGPCSHPGPPPQPPRPCTGCGQVRRHQALGLCTRCYQRRPDRAAVTAANLIARLEDPPAWLGEFAAHAAASYSPGWAVALITSLGRLLAGEGSRYPRLCLSAPAKPAPARRIVPWPGSWGTSSPPAAWPCHQTRGPRCGPHAASAWSMPSPRSCALVPPGSASTCSTPATVPAGRAPGPAPIRPSSAACAPSGTWRSS